MRFVCVVDANPFTADTVEWELPDRPGGVSGWMDRSKIQIVNENTSVLTIYDVAREDAGRVICKANNGIKGIVATKTTRLIVNRKTFSKNLACFCLLWPFL